jgi:hypothetical protein
MSRLQFADHFVRLLAIQLPHHFKKEELQAYYKLIGTGKFPGLPNNCVSRLFDFSEGPARSPRIQLQEDYQAPQTFSLAPQEMIYRDADGNAHHYMDHCAGCLLGALSCCI